ncbi:MULTISPECIES: N-formylglutamate amidohydrolase [unclassified Azospirillum]|uniref:N-formylglutamate amidohydrolase n=1 Tax=unclassified Azospirillum TaxID=2630922 RepID=UPI000B737A43|nr:MULTISPECIES: N-formylglutamate amidohydrolase [unclassified Azospirillum]SNS30381.1 Predicted N-formylglutamate amidohydrolase [Azospirillum sp. RU38E]SNS48827.1 Predicted N-formylglutamate amidohydrolase [Azospirillum sp. RU37A]
MLEAPLDTPLLTAADPAPVRLLNPQSASPILLVCDHAGNSVPQALGDLGGVPAAELDRHIGWDIGAAAVTAELSRRLDAAALLTVYSRLVVDCNRRPDDPTSMPTISDGTPIPANVDISPAARQARLDALFHPYHQAISARLTAIRHGGRQPVLVSIHSFTPTMRGVARPWHVGVLWNQDGRIALPLLAALRAEGDIVVGDNEPYSARTGTDYTIIQHPEPTGIPSVMLEIRQDLIADAAGAAAWGERLARLLGPLLAASTVSAPPQMPAAGH